MSKNGVPSGISQFYVTKEDVKILVAQVETRRRGDNYAESIWGYSKWRFWSRLKCSNQVVEKNVNSMKVDDTGAKKRNLCVVDSSALGKIKASSN